MVKSSRGFRTGTRRKLKRKSRDKFTVEKHIQEFKKGDKVIVKIDPSSQKSMPHYRYQGVLGTVKNSRGRGYVVDVKLGNKKKELTTKAEHLKVF